MSGRAPEAQSGGVRRRTATAEVASRSETGQAGRGARLTTPGAKPESQPGRGAVLQMGTTKIDRTPPAGLSTGASSLSGRVKAARPGRAAGSAPGGGVRASDRPGARPDRATAYSARRRPDRPGSRQVEESAWLGATPETGPAEQVAQEKAMSRPMAVLVLVACMVAAVFIVMSPLRTLMEQRAERADLVERIAQAQERNENLRQELAKWDDPNVVRREARERLGFVQPGEKVYIVTDPSVAQPGAEETEDPALRIPTQAESWLLTLWQGRAPSSIPLRDQPTAPPGIIKQDGEK